MVVSFLERRTEMRKLVLIVAFAAFGFVVSEASAVTVINVTQDEVKGSATDRTSA